MAEFNRDEREIDTSTALAKAQAKARRALLDALGEAVLLASVTSAVWDEIAALYRAALQPALETTFVAAAQASMSAGVSISWDLVNQRAAEWASSYSFELVRGIVDNDKRFLQSAVDSFYRDKLSLGDLADKLARYKLDDKLTRYYGAVRAEMIAVTETTRAAVEADRLYVGELRKMGAQMRGIVETNQDEKVCIVCGPKHGKDVTEVGYPPFHPRCRCNVRYVNEV